MKLSAPVTAGIIALVVLVLAVVGYFTLRSPQAGAPTAGTPGQSTAGPPSYPGAAEAAKQHPAGAAH